MTFIRSLKFVKDNHAMITLYLGNYGGELLKKVGRMTSIEFHSENEVEIFINLHRTRVVAELGVGSHCITQPGPSSCLVLSIYSDEETALELQEERKNYVKSTIHLFATTSL